MILAFKTQNTYDTGDSIQHYLCSRYALAHPELFLDSWAKPLFVLLTVLPSQAGFVGIMLFQCLVAALSAHLAFRVAVQLRMPAPWLAVPFTYAAPDYFLMQFSGLTEPLFGLVLILGVALAAHNRVGWSALVLSWLPFVRAEGFVLLIVWVVYLLVSRNMRWLAMLAIGFSVYSVAGWLAFDELGWVFGRNAYRGGQSSYGHGNWFDYIVHLQGWLGWALLPLFVAGMVWGAVAWLRPAWRHRPAQWTTELLLVYGSIVAYITAHSTFWALGIFKSYGMTRVLAALTPLAAIVAISGLAVLTGWLKRPEVRQRVQIALVAVVLIYPLTGLNLALRWRRDFGPQGELVLNHQVADWIHHNYPAGPPALVTTMPALHFVLGTDPFANYIHRFDVVAAQQPLPAGTVLVWDSRIAVVDDGVTLTQLRSNPQYALKWQRGIPRNLTKPHANDSTHVAVFVQRP
ncbi:hypothetical protein [Hymenobacter negativus]|uniref:Glycosyltransferase RgtA/B/C/D-like domain-containing protein n=1 Tax=Hymenobacter negativus TaxID=2795026 RepID=A0ABS3QGV6_9BACT|nr:hypothetical protein [Hymenobacter negativus]MBO2010483.1 hypothetical protein [Hymenobacter negativus]